MGDARDIATRWLAGYAHHVCSGDVDGTVSSFLPDGWLRDILTFTWDNRSLAGRAKISAYLSGTLASTHIADVKLDERPGLQPEFVPLSPSSSAIGAGFTFTSSVARGQGYFRLLFDDTDGEWRALTVLMMVDDLKGHEEAGPEEGIYGGHTLSWEEVNRTRRAKIEDNPHVIIGVYPPVRFHNGLCD